MTKRPFTDLESAAAGFDDSMLHCRGRTHDWVIRQVSEISGYMYEILEACRYCKAQKTYEKNLATGRESPHRIKYPEGYLLKGVGHLPAGTKAMFRTEIFSRVIHQSERRTK